MNHDMYDQDYHDHAYENRGYHALALLPPVWQELKAATNMCHAYHDHGYHAI